VFEPPQARWFGKKGEFMTDRLARMAALFALYTSLSTPAYAYLDPATGSIILQAIVGVVGTWMVYSRLFVAKSRNFLSRVFGKSSASQDAE
jgi:hypothetical protein